MKKVFTTAAFITIALLSGCSIFQKDSFEGEWILNMDGAIQESFNFLIDANNEFSFSKSVSYGGQDYNVTIKGKIEKDGTIKADIFAGGQSMGEFKGMMTFENGSGTWNASILSGRWTAIKK